MRLAITISILFITQIIFGQDFASDNTILRIEKLKSPKEKAILYNNATEKAWQLGNLKEALEYSDRGLKIAKKNNFKSIESELHNNRGVTYDLLNQYPAALKHFFAGLTIQDKLNEPKMKSTLLGNIGLIYGYQEANEKAMNYHKRALKISRSINDKAGISVALNNLAIVQVQLGKYEEAIANYLACIKIDSEANDTIGLGDDYNNIALVYMNTKDYKKSREYLEKALKIRTAANNRGAMAITYSNLGELSFFESDYEKAQELFLKAIELGREVNDKECLKYVYLMLKRNSEKLTDSASAYAYYKQHIAYKDSVENADLARKQTELELNYQFNKEKEVARLRQQEKDRQYNIILIAVSSGLILILLFFILFFRKWKQTQAQQLIIEERNRMVQQKNDEIMASINYAKRIQNAILPSSSALYESYPSHFTLYLPKDVVSGDFYWMNERDNTRFLAVADCTGHGVPGALMSVVCHNALNRALHEFNQTSPAAILDKTRELVINELSQHEDSVADGMDISLCAFGQDSNALKWAGANNPLWIYRKSLNDIEEIKADKQPIGNHKHPTPFKEHRIELRPGDRIYLFSDGYQDQFGGKNVKKMMRKGFKNAILDTVDSTIKEQNLSMVKIFRNWQGNEEQVDDVCVIGIEYTSSDIESTK